MRPFLPGPISQPTLEMTIALSRETVPFFSHLPMISSESPPLLPGTQAE
ncbi:MAG: hypothetical protein JWL84_3565 [Rhodospirillales bacterium]|nr:hypothetical protein [Rhodospirillales bacterium]